MPEPGYELDLKRLERCAELVGEVAAERERLRTLLQQARLILDRIALNLPAAHRAMAPEVRAFGSPFVCR